MITKEKFQQGKAEVLQAEINTIVRELENTLNRGFTTTTTYKKLTNEDIVVHAVSQHVAQFGWTLRHSVYHGDQRDPGPTHTWTLA